MARLRTRFQGISNVVRFNWHFYVLAGAVLLGLGLFATYTTGIWQIVAGVAMAGAVVLIFSSLVVTYWVYDWSNLYSLDWLRNITIPKHAKIVNIHAGFDETSELLHYQYPAAELVVLDFYDPEKHTEVSIKRARKAYPPYPGTLLVNVAHLPFADGSVDAFFGILAVHEIRDEGERVVFFKEVHRVLKPDGIVVVTEHLRDTANFMAYNMGAFHFHAHSIWLAAFATAGLHLHHETKITPFISTFILTKNGTAP